MAVKAIDWKYVEDTFYFRNIGTDDYPIFEPINITHVDTSFITEVGKHYVKHGKYPYAPPKDPAAKERWLTKFTNRDLPANEVDFWLREMDRVYDGVLLNNQLVNGQYKDVYVSGAFYFKLNYCPIDKLVVLPDGSDYRDIGMPDFWHWQFMYDNGKRLARYLGKNILIVKSRQTGFSNDLSDDFTYDMYTTNHFRGLIAAFDATFLSDKDQGGTLDKIRAKIFHLNESTPFWMPVLNDAVDGIAFGRKTQNGTKFISGVTALSFAKKAGKGVGKSLHRIGIEEVGEFENVMDMYTMMGPAMYSGTRKTALCTFHGTAGKNARAQREFLSICDNPQMVDAIVFSDWLRKKPRPKGYAFFYGRQLNLYPEFTDKDGNSADEDAKNYIINVERPSKKETLSIEDYEAYLAQYPVDPDELSARTSDLGLLPVELIDAVIDRIKNDPRSTEGIRYGIFQEISPGEVVFVENSKLLPSQRHDFIDESRFKEIKDFTGCWALIKDPIRIGKTVPTDAYIGAYDPYGIDKKKNALTGRDSIGAFYVMEQIVPGYNTGCSFAAVWLGRPGDVKDADAQVLLGCKFFNLRTSVSDKTYRGGNMLFENNRSQVFTNFSNWGEIEYMMRQPANRTNRDIYTETQDYGITLTPGLKQRGVELVNKLLSMPIGLNTHGNVIHLVDTLPILPILTRLSTWTGDLTENFDSLSALIILAYAYEEYNALRRGTTTTTEEYSDSYYDVFEQGSEPVTNFNDRVKQQLRRYGSRSRELSETELSDQFYYENFGDEG